jgi:hypothetical protein
MDFSRSFDFKSAREIKIKDQDQDWRNEHLPLPILEQLRIFLSDFLSFPTARAVPLNSSFKYGANKRMSAPGKTFSSVESHDNGTPLPLFRPEAVAALQQKFYGEIVLIRPFPLMLLCWFALGITAAVLGFLFLGQYTEKASVPGIITSGGLVAPNAAEAAVYVPARMISRLHPGTQLSLHCDSCPAQFARQIGTVLEISQSPASPLDLSQANLNLAGSGNTVAIYKIKVSLPPQAAQTMQVNPSTQAGVRVEAEIPLGHKPLIKWFFERSGS